MPALPATIARTPLHSWHAAHGAQFEERHGWQVVSRYLTADQEVQAAQAGLAVADISASAKVSVQGPGVSALARKLVPDGSAARPLDVGFVSAGRAALACRLTEDHLLVLAMSAWATDDSARLAELCRGQAVVSSDVTSAYAGFCVVGPHVETMLSRLTHLDVRLASFPMNSCLETSLAGVEALLVRLPGLALSAVRVYVAWDMAEYVWERLLEEGHDWHITPIGLEALERLARKL